MNMPSFHATKTLSVFLPAPPPPRRPLMTSVLHCHLQEEGKMFFDKSKEGIYEESCNNVNILPDSFLHGKKISEDYFESFCPFSNREKTKVLNRLKFRLMKM